MSSQETGYRVEHGTGHDVGHTTGHEAGHTASHETGHTPGHGVETREFWNNWWPLFVILLGFTFFVIISAWHPSY